mgnify:CR=1 FL=1
MFIDNLMKILKERNIKQSELCEKANIPKSNINHWKNGTQPTIDKVIKIAEILNVSIDYLIYGEEKESRLEKLYNMATKDEQKIIDIMLEKYEHQGTSSNYRIG